MTKSILKKGRRLPHVIMGYTAELIDSKRMWIGHYPSSDTKAPDGRILVGTGDNLGGYGMFSCDKGDTWEIIRGMRSIPRMLNLSDGRYFATGFGNIAARHIDPERQKKIPYVMKKMWADSFDDILDGNLQADFEVIDIPDLAVGYGDSQNYHTGVTGSGLIELPDGKIMIAMYGQFKQDKTRLPYFEKYDFYQYRTWVMISHDMGETFEYLSTVADCQTYPFNPDAEGFCEPDLLYLGGEHILCVMRTQGHEVYTPMYASHSYDMGKTWSTPEVVAPYGVAPKLLRLSCGAIVCAAGKWGTFFLISDDEGKSWSDPVVLSANKGQWDRGPSGYVSLIETNPNEILIVWDETEDQTSDDIPQGERRIVYVNRYKIIQEQA